MKNFDSRTYSINDFLEWDKNKQLELSPKFQRRSVWTDNAKSYLMDTIIRGKPIPKVFIRQKLNATTRQSIREIVDGQQRLRTILSYMNDGFPIFKRHHKVYGGYYFSQLSNVAPELGDIQASLLNYEISVDLLVNMPDEEVLDIFARLNSYSVILNEQEKLHANHFGPFKSLAEHLGHKYYRFWLDSRIFNENEILRMKDANMAADLLIAIIEGIKNKKQIKNFYRIYERKFDYDSSELVSKFSDTINKIASIFPEGLEFTEFSRPPLFYTLFTTCYHLLYDLKGLTESTNAKEKSNQQIRFAFDRVSEVFSVAAENLDELQPTERQFLEDCRSATTDGAVRVRRTQFLLSLLD